MVRKQTARPSEAEESTAWKRLNRRIVQCEACPRLIAHCRKVAAEKRAAYRDEEYWGKPVPNMGHDSARLLIVGLAPGAHGANRTGRMFTGDRSGDWLFRSMHRTGFASQAEAVTRDDGLKLINCAITAGCHCAPPDNKPTTDELVKCSGFMDDTFRLVNPDVVVTLGGLAWKAVLQHLRRDDRTVPKPQPKFGHGAEVLFDCGLHMLGSFHPSQQNTFTGRLTESMLDAVFRRAAVLLKGSPPVR